MALLKTSYLRENIVRQSKRLSEKLAVPLTTAKEILASGPYGCASWADLNARLESPSPHDESLILAALPHVDAAQAYFANNIRELAKALSRRILTNTNLAGLYEILRYVFVISQVPVSLSDIATKIEASAWQPSHIGPDPAAVIHAYTRINDTYIKLIATRVYLPEYYDLGEHYQPLAKIAEPYNEKIKIIWSDPMGWYKATCDYLEAFDRTADDDEYDVELILPEEHLDEAMRIHQRWFDNALNAWRDESRYGESDQYFVPYALPLGCYLVLGVPCTAPANLPVLNSTSVAFDSEWDNDTTLVTLGKQPVCIEWITINNQTRQHDGEHHEHFKSLMDGVFSHSDCELDQFQSEGRYHKLFYITPASNFAIDSYLKVELEPSGDEEFKAGVTDNPFLASKIVDYASTRRLMGYQSKLGTSNFLMKIEAKESLLEKASLALIAYRAGNKKSYNLITQSLLTRRAENSTVVVNIQAALLSLCDLIDKRVLKDAIHHGIVVYCDPGFLDDLDVPSKRSKGLQVAPQSLIETLEQPFQEKDFSLHDLFSNLTLAHYTRRNH